MLTLFLTSILFNFAPVITQASLPISIFSVQPSNIVDSALVPGSSFSVGIYVFEAVDIYAWQVYIEWDPAVLEVTYIAFGGFLSDQPEGSATFSKIEPGFLIATEYTYGNYAGKDAEIALLFTVTFSVKTYGETILDISGGEKNDTYYLRVTDLPRPHYPMTVNGYFKNGIPWWLLPLIFLLLMLGLFP